MRKKRWIAALLAVVLLASAAPVCVKAGSRTPGAEEFSFTYVNPIYAEIVSEQTLLPESSFSAKRLLEDSEESAEAEQQKQEEFIQTNTFLTSAQEAGEQMRWEMKARNGVFSLFLQAARTADAVETQVLQLANEILEVAFAHTGAPKEGDYLRFQFGGYDGYVTVVYNETTCYVQIDYQVKYYTTWDQETEFDTRLAAVMESLQLSCKSDYQKIKDIYDYICANVTYDYTNVEDASYTRMFTGYAALMEGTAVCQGYAVLLYRMALEAGIDCRVIAGKAGGVGHAWNIVLLGGLYYNMDSTWGAGTTVNYSYFLQPDGWKGHTRDTEYRDSFYETYPMGKTEYSPVDQDLSLHHSWNEGEVTTEPTETAEGVRTYTCTACGETKTESIPATGPAEEPPAETKPTEPGSTAPSSPGAGSTMTNGGAPYVPAAPSVPAEPDVTPEPEPEAPETPVFTDVPQDAYYSDAVSWAVERGIATGSGEDTFSPENDCTRAEAVTFLWRAAGSPEPKGTNSVFNDVTEGQYYTKAVQWAVENGITTGVIYGRFAPDAACTRAQIVTFLWRFAGREAASDQPFFIDVKNDAYYEDAVQWAVANGITRGTGSYTFSPSGECSRAQIVTFLYRNRNSE